MPVADPAFADYARGSRWHQLVLRHGGMDPDGMRVPMQPAPATAAQCAAALDAQQRREIRDAALCQAVRRTYA